MRFNRFKRAGAYEDTNRKRAAVVRRQRLEREALPLFAEAIAATQDDVETVMQKQAVAWDLWQQDFRDGRARNWRRARAELAKFGDNIRPVLRKLWSEAPYPGAPEYLLDFLHRVRVGRIDLDNPPWRPKHIPELRKVDFDAIRAAARQRMQGGMAA